MSRFAWDWRIVLPLFSVDSDFDNLVTIPTRTSVSNSAAASGFRCRRFGFGAALALRNCWSDSGRNRKASHTLACNTANSGDLLAPIEVPGEVQTRIAVLRSARSEAVAGWIADAAISCYKPMTGRKFPLS